MAANVITAIVEYQQRTTFKPVLAAGYRLTNARLADIHDEDIRAMFGIDDAIASNPWRFTAGQNQEPPSWPVADILQDKGYHGLLYRLQINGGTCLVLWAWNAPMAPMLLVIDPDRRLPPDDRSGILPDVLRGDSRNGFFLGGFATVDLWARRSKKRTSDPSLPFGSFAPSLSGFRPL